MTPYTYMFRTIIIGLFCSLLTTSCALNYLTFDTESRAKSIELGMSIEEVKGVMGRFFIKDSAFKDEDGDTHETIAYKSDNTTEFHFHFRNGLLESWNREHFLTYPSDRE